MAVFNVGVTGRNYAGESASDRAARRRRQLLDAGLQVFGTDGYRSATVRGICREAKVADRNFYEDFESTESLLLAVYDECIERLMRASSQAALQAGADVVQRARRGLEAFLATVHQDPRLARVVWVEVLGISPEVERVYLTRMAEFGELLWALLPEPGALQVSLLERDLALQSAVGGISHVVTRWMVDGFAVDVESMASALTRVLVSVLSGIGSSGLEAPG